MINNIAKLFPGSVIQTVPITDDCFLCFFDEASMQFIAIPKQSVTDREKLLLESMFTIIDQSSVVLNQTVAQKMWFDFLLGDREIPASNGQRIRFIHFNLEKNINAHDFMPAIQSFLQDGMTLVWIDSYRGVIIEEESVNSMPHSEFLSLSEAILSDFYFELDFYIGRFYEPNQRIKNAYQNEVHYFLMAKRLSPKEQIFTFEKSFPLALIASAGEKLHTILQFEWEDIFQNNQELLMTIKLFIENNSNISLTAKKLFLHRNSLQYRIDKFVEKTSIDIKNFHGALSVYFICLYGETVGLSQEFKHID